MEQNGFTKAVSMFHHDASHKWRISRWLPGRPSWIMEQNGFTKAVSMFHHDASHKWRISRWLPGRPSWIMEQNGFTKAVSMFHHDASHKWRISRWLPGRPSWIMEQNGFTKAVSMFHHDASHKWRISRWLPGRPSWIMEQNGFTKAVSMFHHHKFQFNQIYRSGEDFAFEFQDGHQYGHLGYQNRRTVGIQNLHFDTMSPTKFSFNLTWFAFMLYASVNNFSIRLGGFLGLNQSSIH